MYENVPHMKTLLFALSLLAFVSLNAQEFQWAGRITGVSDDRVSDVVGDKFGNVYTLGTFHSNVDFNPSTTVTYTMSSSSGSDDVYIQKMDSAGNFLWAKKFGGNSEDRPGRVAVDDAGNVYFTGKYDDIVDFDPGTGVYNLGSEDRISAVTVKLNSSGNFVWAKAFKGIGNNGYAIGQSIEVDKWNNVYVGGIYSGFVDFNPDSNVVYQAQDTDVLNFYLCKLDAQGNFDWLKAYQGYYDNENSVADITSDINGYIYATGIFRGSPVFPSGQIFGSGTYVLKVDTGGNDIWDRKVGDGSTTPVVSYGICVDGVGAVYIAGSASIADFDPSPNTTYTTTGSAGAFILKLNASGNFVWLWNTGGNGTFNHSATYSIDMSPSGFIYATGSFLDSVDFDNGPAEAKLISAGGTDIFTVKLDTARNFVWARKIGNLKYDYGLGINVNSNEDVFTVGTYRMTNDFNPDDSLTFIMGSSYLNPDYTDDVFIQKLSNTPCSNLTLIIDSLRDVTCIDSGKIWAHAINGYGFSYAWNTTPVVATPNLTTPSSGVYVLTVTDGLQCQRSATVVLPGPTAQQGYDLNANMVTGNFRTGFRTFIQLDALNEGCVSVDGQLKLVLDNLVHYDSSSIVPTAIVGDTLIWDFTDLIFDSAHILPRVYVTTSTGAHVGDTVCFDMFITPDSTDIDTTNNIKKYCYRVINAFDPNYIAVYPEGECVPAYVQKSLPLTYTIHFQNTGNSHAVNVYLLDTLPASLDVNTIQVIAQSHSVNTDVLNNNVLRFRFDNIMLIDSATSPDSSQGYVIYEIRPVVGTADNTPVNNRAAIYFDYNAPVITNTVHNTLVLGPVDSTYCNTIIGINEVDKYRVSIYPNPNNGAFTISMEDGLMEHIQVSDISGRVVYSQAVSNTSIIDVELNQVPGIYLITVQCNGITTTHKLIKY